MYIISNHFVNKSNLLIFKFILISINQILTLKDKLKFNLTNFFNILCPAGTNFIYILYSHYSLYVYTYKEH